MRRRVSMNSLPRELTREPTVCEESIHLTRKWLRVRDLSEDALDGRSRAGDKRGARVDGSERGVASGDGGRLSVDLNSYGQC